MLSADAPFVLLDDAREGGRQILYRDPIEIVATRDPAAVDAAIERLRGAVAAGLNAAGWLGYEAGLMLEPRLVSLAAAPDHDQPWLLWFGLFTAGETLPPGKLGLLLPDPAGAWIGAVKPRIERDDHRRAHDRVQALIAAGDIYQANLSFRADVPVLGDPLALYARLRVGARAGWGGIVYDGRRWLLSCSPELFFETDGARIIARPMKGTAPRGSDPIADACLAVALAADPKERAENLMIVDLIRNDLSRVAVPGSVHVPELFAVERYPTIQQMVSTVEAELAPDRDAIDALRALFPCGSITGAPKLRAIEVIAEVETDMRGPYTGAIGRLAPDGSAAFNVAIRTLVLEEGADVATIGLGSAVVADSTAAGEWAECLAKGAFVSAGQRPFDLIETLRFDPDDGLIELDRHIARLGASAAALGFRFDRHAARNELHAAIFRLQQASKVRLMLAPGGAIAIECSPLPAPPVRPAELAIVPLPVDPSDFRLAHKTSDRAFYDDARRAAGTFEVLFQKPDGALTEGSFTSLFVRRDDNLLVTPPLSEGLLPGVLRARLIAEGEAVEGRLTIADLTHGFLIGNALRGLIPATVAVGGGRGL